MGTTRYKSITQDSSAILLNNFSSTAALLKCNGAIFVTEKGLFWSPVSKICVMFIMLKRKGTCNQWTENVKKNAVKNLMEGNVNIRIASGFSEFQIIPLKKTTKYYKWR